MAMVMFGAAWSRCWWSRCWHWWRCCLCEDQSPTTQRKRLMLQPIVDNVLILSVKSSSKPLKNSARVLSCTRTYLMPWPLVAHFTLVRSAPLSLLSVQSVPRRLTVSLHTLLSAYCHSFAMKLLNGTQRLIAARVMTRYYILPAGFTGWCQHLEEVVRCRSILALQLLEKLVDLLDTILLDHDFVIKSLPRRTSDTNLDTSSREKQIQKEDQLKSTTVAYKPIVLLLIPIPYDYLLIDSRLC